MNWRVPSRPACTASAGHELRRFQRTDRVERRGPIAQIRIARVGRSTVLDQIAGEENFFLRQPDDRIALGVAASELHDLDLQFAQPKRQSLLEHERRPGKPRNRLNGLEKAREAFDLAFHVLRAALDDEVVSVAAGDDVLRSVARSAEDADGVVVREHDVADRLVGHLANAPDDVLRHHGRGLGVDHQDRVVADDDAGIGVALGRVGVCMLGELVEADLLLFEVCLGSEFLFGHASNLIPGLAAVKAAQALLSQRTSCSGCPRKVSLPWRRRP